MSNLPINFFNEDIDFEAGNITFLKAWIKSCIQNERQKLSELNFIFCSDAYLLGLNQTYLAHHTFTDVITFDHSTKKGQIEGDVFISVERVGENADTYDQTENDELHRVMIHGVLHLCGFTDKTEKDKIRIRDKENFYLLKRHF